MLKFTYRAISAIALVSVLTLTSACVPGDETFSIGVARIGDRYHLLIPMCDGESLTGLKVTRSPNPEVGGIKNLDDPAFTYWSVTGPKESTEKGGLLSLGDDGAWSTVTVAAGSQTELPDFISTVVSGTSPEGDFETSAGMYLSDAPAAPSGSAPETVLYAWSDGKELEKLSPDEIRERSGCARKYP